MADSRAFTSSYRRAADFADAALLTIGGVDLIFEMRIHGTKEACQTAARSFTKSFHAMRSQDRNRSAGAKKEREKLGYDPAVSNILSPYDVLDCVTKPLEDGSYMVSLVKGNDVSNSILAIDRATGKPLETLGSGVSLYVKLIRKFLEHRADFTIEDFDALTHECSIWLEENKDNPNVPKVQWYVMNDVRREDFRPLTKAPQGTAHTPPTPIINSPHDSLAFSMKDMEDFGKTDGVDTPSTEG